MDNTLCHHDDRNSVIMGYTNDFPERVHQSQNIGYVCYGKQFRLPFPCFCQEFVPVFWDPLLPTPQPPILQDWPRYVCTSSARGNVEWCSICEVITIRSPGRIPVCPNEKASRLSEAGSAAGENHLVDRGGIDEIPYSGTCPVIPFGGLHAKVMDCPVDVPVQSPLHFLEDVQYLPGFWDVAPLSR